MKVGGVEGCKIARMEEIARGTSLVKVKAVVVVVVFAVVEMVEKGVVYRWFWKGRRKEVVVKVYGVGVGGV